MSTLEIKAIEGTGSPLGGASVLPELLDQILSAGPSAASANDTRPFHAAIAACSDCADIPACKNARPWRKNTFAVQARNAAVRAIRHLSCANCRNRSGYHLPSPAETKTRCFNLHGERFMAHDFDTQVAELSNKAAILKRFTSLETP